MPDNSWLTAVGIHRGMLVAILLLGAAPSAPGQCPPRPKLTASDAAPSDLFGYAVAISGDTAIVGSIQDVLAGGQGSEPNGEGSAYVYVRSAGNLWSQQAKLTASDAAPADFFGSNVAISGDTAVVGARQDVHAPGPGSLFNGEGSAYVFVRTGTVWTQQAKLIASDGSSFDSFGGAVAIWDDTIVIGAFRDANAGGVGAGSAYVFVRTGTVWTQQTKLMASDAAADNMLGFSVAIEGDTAVVGARFGDHVPGSNSGAAYVFVRSGAVWSQQGKLFASDAATYDEFGVSVSVSGDTAVVGARTNDNHGGTDAGAAYVLVRTGTAWSEQAKLLASDPLESDQFGYSVAVWGNVAIVGAWYGEIGRNDSASGLGYAFARSGPQGNQVWNQTKILTPCDAHSGDFLGFAVAISDRTAVIGAYGDDHLGGFDAGSAHVFLCPACSADVNHSCAVDIDDLVLVITSWGATIGFADANYDNIVNIDDLVIVVTSWGPCP